MLLPTSMREKYRIRFENNTCEVEGRTFMSEHVILLSPSKVKIIMSEDTVKMEAEYSKMPRTLNHGNYLLISTNLESGVPGYETFEGTVREEGETLKGEGELGIRGSWSRHYAKVEIMDRNEGSVIRVFGNELILEGSAIDMINLLGGRFQTFFVKTSPSSLTEVTKEGEKVKIRVVPKG